jgi:ABC-type Mn2+/Zn2+ transport system ATPase subunit
MLTWSQGVVDVSVYSDRNGAGKTTFLKALAGLLHMETGSVQFGGHDQTRTRYTAYLPQRSAIDWDFPTTVRGLVEMGHYSALGWWRKFGKEDEKKVNTALQAMQLEDLAERQSSALSGGQQQRAFLARSLAQDAHVLLLDEPFTGLDRPSQDLFGHILKGLARQGNLLIVSHHDLRMVPALFDEVVLLNGELVAWGPTEQVFTEDNISRTFGTHTFSGAHA